MDQGKDAEELTAAARQEDGIWFYVTGDADIAKIFGLNNKAPALVLLKKQNEKRSTFGMISFFWSWITHFMVFIYMQTTKTVCL